MSCRSDPVTGSIRPPALAVAEAGEEDWLAPVADEEAGAVDALVVLDPGAVAPDPEPLPLVPLGLVVLELLARTTIDPCMKG